MRRDEFSGVINCGGLATRARRGMAPLGEHGVVLKALARIGNPPIPLIEHHVNYHLANGATSVIASVGPHQKVADRVARRYAGRDNVGSFQVDHALGTGGDLLRLIRNREIVERLSSLVVITNVDTITDVKLQDVVEFHRRYGDGLTVALSSLRGVPHQDSYYVGSHYKVVYSDEVSDKTRTEQDAVPLAVYKGSSTGIMVADTDFLRNMPWSTQDKPLSLYQDIVGYAINQGAMTAFNNGDRFFMDIGTSDAWQRTQDPVLAQDIQGCLYYSR